MRPLAIDTTGMAREELQAFLGARRAPTPENALLIREAVAKEEAELAAARATWPTVLSSASSPARGPRANSVHVSDQKAFKRPSRVAQEKADYIAALKRLVREGGPDAALAEEERVLGHSHSRVTELYSHLLPDHLAATRNVVTFDAAK
jgi:hypothetical protein